MELSSCYVVEIVLRLSLADRLVVFKESIPQSKRQALRADLASIPTKKSTASKNVISYECGICGNPCTSDYDSIVSAMCGVRCHHGCLGLTKLSVWVCPQCVSVKCDTGQGKGKKGRQGKCSKFK